LWIFCLVYIGFGFGAEVSTTEFNNTAVCKTVNMLRIRDYNFFITKIQKLKSVASATIVASLAVENVRDMICDYFVTVLGWFG
jgi:hypothetical protein